MHCGVETCIGCVGLRGVMRWGGWEGWEVRCDGGGGEERWGKRRCKPNRGAPLSLPPHITPHHQHHQYLGISRGLLPHIKPRPGFLFGSVSKTMLTYVTFRQSSPRLALPRPPRAPDPSLQFAWSVSFLYSRPSYPSSTSSS